MHLSMKGVSSLDMNTEYPKRLIEVDLPIKRIAEHARGGRRVAGTDISRRCISDGRSDRW